MLPYDFRANYRSKPKPPIDDDSDDSIDEDNFHSVQKVKFVDQEQLQNKLSSPSIAKKQPISNDYNIKTKSDTNTKEKDTLLPKEDKKSDYCENRNEPKVLQKVENSYNCDSLKNLVNDKIDTDLPKTTDDTKEVKEKRVTFFVENNDCKSESSESIDPVEEEISKLQEVKEDSSSEDKDTLDTSESTSGKKIQRLHFLANWLYKTYFVNCILLTFYS